MKNPDSEGCIFCKASKGENDRKSGILFRGNFSFVLMNKYPYNNGHIMVAPYRHTGDFNALNKDEMIEMSNLLGTWQRVVKQAMHTDGFNIGMNLGQVAGAGVKDHLHFHIVPRWDGDTNFMPIIGEVKVVSEGLQQTWEKLKQGFDGLGA